MNLLCFSFPSIINDHSQVCLLFFYPTHKSTFLARHEFYESDERVVLSVFDRGADPAQVTVTFEPRKVIFSISLHLRPNKLIIYYSSPMSMARNLSFSSP